jgi:site-specific DNA recombinase
METTITKKTIRAAIYIRVSTDEQVRGGYGLDVQDEKLRTFIKLNDYILDEKHIYRDEGFSGTLPVEERPGMKRMMEDAKKREFDVVVAYRLDRLFRKTRLLLNVLEELDNLKIGFKSVTESIDTSTHTGRLVITVLGGIAEMERDTIRERTSNGRITAAKKGRWVTGIPPYGYNLIKETDQAGNRKNTGMLEINKEEAKWVRQFFRWIVVDRLPLREVQRRANQLKIPIPRRKVSNKKTHNFWHTRTIGRMITNENYTGIASFRKYKRPFKNLTSIIDESLLRKKEDWIEIKIPQIITPAMFERCKQQLIRNRDFSKRNQKRTYLFSKIIYCGACGFKLFGGYQPSKKEGGAGSKYYHGMCSKQQVGETKRCGTCEQVGEIRLLPIWDRLKEILKRPQITLERLTKYNKDKNKDDDTKDQLDQIKKALEIAEEKRPRLALLFSEGEMDHEAYRKTLLECKTKEGQLREEQMRLERQLLTRGEIKDIAKIIEAQYKKLLERLDSLNYEEKQEVLRLMLKKVIVYPKKGEAEMELTFKTGEIAISPLIGALPVPAYAGLWDDNAKNGLTTINKGREKVGVSRLRGESIRRICRVSPFSFRKPAPTLRRRGNSCKPRRS